MREKNAPRVNLKGKLLTVGEGGINAHFNDTGLYLDGGYITAAGASLVIKAGTYGSSVINAYGDKEYRAFHIRAVIQNDGWREVGLTLTGSHPDNKRRGLVRLGGNMSNTFTGDVVVEGIYNTLFLDKVDGAEAIKSKHIYVKDRARLAISLSNQINDGSTVTLVGSGSMLSFTGASSKEMTKSMSEKIHELVVESGTGVFHFMHPNKFKDISEKTIILDDLIIEDGAMLRISSWEEGRDHFLVRKDSKHLADAMKKVTILGWGKDQVYLKDYDKEYWSIEAAPEPAVCGAILGAVGGGVVMWRRRARRGP